MDYDASYNISSKSTSNISTDPDPDPEPDPEPDPDPISDDDETETSTYQNLYAVTYGNNKFIAVGNRGKILYSDNGSSWDNGTSGITSRLNEITYSNNASKYIAVGHSGKIISSSSGSTWDNAIDKNSTIYGIAYKSSNGRLTIVDMCCILNNASTWTTVSSGTLYDL